MRRRWFSRGGEPGQPSDQQGEELLRRWRRGDDRAFADIFRTYRALVYGVLHHLLPGDPDIEDVVQTAFMEVFRSLDSFEGRSKLSSWIARIALHVGYHHLRRRRNHPADYSSDAAVPERVDGRPEADPEAGARRHEAVHRIHEILALLPEKKRTVFILNDLQGLPQEEVAEIVNASVATVRTRLFYARREFWRRAAQDPVLSDLVDVSPSARSKA
ncbi:MAG: sigma-70 family RNA polymerase sigma factor [Myxococcota bacterium]